MAEHADQTLPGPASSQVGISIGILRAGLLGGVAAWLGFTLPSAIALVVFASAVPALGPEASGWLHGLKIVAVSIDDPGTEAAIRTFAQQYKLTFEILHDPTKAIVDAYDITGYPETFIVGRDGIIRKKLMQATDWNSPDARALMDRLLAEQTE